MEEKSKKKFSLKDNIFITIGSCLILAFLFTRFVVRSVEVEGYSMASTLSDGDKGLTDALFFRMGKIDRFDIVIVKLKNNNLYKDEMIKRVIGLPNDKIVYDDGVLTVNGEVINEEFIDSYVKESTGYINITLKDDEYFVMGDNRGNSSDSRYFGAIKKNEIRARGFLRFMVCKEKDSNNECSKRKFVWFESVK